MRIKSPSLAGALVFWAALPFLAAQAGETQATTSVALARGEYKARFYTPAKGAAPRALVIFGSGDGGWSYWEERVCRHLAEKGVASAGIDFHAYAGAVFTPEVLRRDFRSLAAELRRRHPGAESLPLFYGGWSMGAEQAVPAAAEAEARAPGLRGLILVAPGARGRYGLQLRDRMGLAPTGPGTFALRDFAPRCADLRMAVFHAGLDPLDDLKWSEGLELDRKLWVLPRTFHDFAGAGDEFLAKLDEAMEWLLETPPPAKRAQP